MLDSGWTFCWNDVGFRRQYNVVFGNIRADIGAGRCSDVGHQQCYDVAVRRQYDVRIPIVMEQIQVTMLYQQLVGITQLGYQNITKRQSIYVISIYKTRNLQVIWI